MRVLFMGTPQFAVNSLNKLYENEYSIVGVVTQPDKPKGRGHKLLPPPVKERAMELMLPVYQPHTLKDGIFFEEIKRLQPDVIVVAAYGKILPEDIIRYPKYHCINVHASLLPKYRGAAPIARCIMDGEKKTGVTTMRMDVGLDTGDMLLKLETDIGDTETTEQLTARLAEIGADLLIGTLQKLEAGELTPQKQDDALATYAHMIERDTGLLDFSQDGKSLVNLIRAVSAYTYYRGNKLKILQAEFLPGQTEDAVYGEIVQAAPEGIDIRVKDGLLRAVRIQMQGKKAMDTGDYLRGNVVEVGTILQNQPS